MKLLTPEKLAPVSAYTGIFDSHIHLDSQAFAADLTDCLARASNAGVKHMVMPSTDENSSRRILELTQKHEQLEGAVGIHPHQAAEFDAQRSPKVWREMLKQGKWVAVGETGLELHYDFCPLEIQKVSLQSQIELAAETGLPLILHCRMAEEPLYEMVKGWAGKVGGVVHCFTGVGNGRASSWTSDSISEWADWLPCPKPKKSTMSPARYPPTAGCWKPMAPTSVRCPSEAFAMSLAYYP
jgi:TatD family hydrolase